MKYYVYVLRSLKDGKNYYGMAKNIEQRIDQHNKGRVKSTRNRRPLKLMYYEIVKTKEEAIKKERYFKSGFGRKYIKNKIADPAPSSNG